MSLSTVRAEIKAMLERADPDSVVHDYERWTTDAAMLLTLFKPETDTHLRAWIFRPASIQEFALSRDSSVAVYLFLLRFIYSLVDAAATEKTALEIIETVREAFRANARLGGRSWSYVPTHGPLEGMLGLQLDKIEIVTLGGVQCHYGELRLAAEEIF
jgi:hypothetical protein